MNPKEWLDEIATPRIRQVVKKMNSWACPQKDWRSRKLKREEETYLAISNPRNFGYALALGCFMFVFISQTLGFLVCLYAISLLSLKRN